MRVKVFDTITSIKKSEWNEILERNRIICSHEYLQAVENSGINDCRHFYPVVYDDNGRIVAHASIYFISTEMDSFAKGKLKDLINLIRKKWKNFLILRSIECGTPVELGSTISFRDGYRTRELLHLIIEHTERTAERLNVGTILFRDYYGKDSWMFDEFKRAGYTKIHNLPTARLKVKWSSFTEYVDSMRSNYKRKVVKRVKKCEDDKVSFSVLSNFSDYADILEKLWQNVYNNAKEYTRERLSASFFKSMDKHLEQRCRIIMATMKGDPVGFSLLMLDDDSLISMFFGLDYRYNKDSCIYFNLFYKTIELAIMEGKKDIDMGITTLAPKKDFGAEPVEQIMFMRHTNPVLNYIIPRAFEGMTPEENMKPRKVFKNTDCPKVLPAEEYCRS